MQIKIKQRFHLQKDWLSARNQAITNVGKAVQKIKPFSTADGSVDWCKHSGYQHGDSSKGQETSFDPAIPLLGKSIESIIAQ